MPPRQGYVYVSKNRVERPVFRGRSSSSTDLSRKGDDNESPPTTAVSSASTSPAPQQSPSLSPFPSRKPTANVFPAPLAPQPQSQPSPPPLPPVNVTRPPISPPRSPEINPNFYSSADCYSNGFLPSRPPWVKASSPPTVSQSEDGHMTPTKKEETPSLEMTRSDSGTEVIPVKKRNTLKKKSKQWFSFHIKTDHL